MSFGINPGLLKHPLTDIGLTKFLEDAKKLWSKSSKLA
jgi:hypothetical protein